MTARLCMCRNHIIRYRDAGQSTLGDSNSNTNTNTDCTSVLLPRFLQVVFQRFIGELGKILECSFNAISEMSFVLKI